MSETRTNSRVSRQSARSRGRQSNSRSLAAVSYHESTSDSSSSEEESSSKDIAPAKRQNALTTAASHRRKRVDQASPRPRKKREVPKPRLARPRSMDKARKNAALPHLSVPLPPWPAPAQLPYDVLYRIFQYATLPPASEERTCAVNAPWLVKVALLRRDFLEPALSALYFCPLLETSRRASGLIRTLRSQTNISAVNYCRKIRYLDIEGCEVLTFKWSGDDPISLADLIELTPGLRGLRIHSPSDVPGSSVEGIRVPGQAVSKWYGQPLYDLLDEKQLRLIEWKWNFTYVTNQPWPWNYMAEIHRRAAFTNLKSLELCRLGDALFKPSKNMELIANLSAAIGELKNLEELVIANAPELTCESILRLFQCAPPLVSLSISGQELLTSECLSEILQEKGANLRHLTLNHARNLDLAFLGDLRIQCPRLISLSMDLTFYSTLGVVRSTAPNFPTLLPDDCEPSWPSTLQRLRLVHLRKWDAEAAYRFFSSLIHAVPDLSQLRYLEIRATLDADWRDRIRFRDVWETRMIRVFRRQSTSPTRWTDHAKRSANAATTAVATKSSARKAKELERLRSRQDTGEEIRVQGMCDYVDVRINNLRPREEHLDESNFLDSEPSGDEDYK